MKEKEYEYDEEKLQGDRIQKLEQRIAFDEGRRAGIKFIIEITAVVVTLIVAAGITTLWVNTRSFQERTLENVQQSLEEQAHVRETEIAVRVNEKMDTLFMEIDKQVATRELVMTAEASTREYIMTVEAVTKEAALATSAAQIIDAIEADANTSILEVELMKSDLATTVFEAVSENLNSDVIVNVAAESLNQKVDEIFEERLQQAVIATQEAQQLEHAATATQETLELQAAEATAAMLALTATPTPTPTP